MSKCKCCGEEIGSVEVCPICGAAHVVAPPPQTTYAPQSPYAFQPTQPTQTAPQPTTNRPRIQNDMDTWANHTTPSTPSAPPQNSFNPHRDDDHDHICDDCGSTCNSEPWAHLFDDEKKWQAYWKKFRLANEEVGIILTNTSKLSSKTAFMQTLGAYVEYKKKEGVYYCLLDLAMQKVARNCATLDGVLRLLSDMNNYAYAPYYLLIVGDRTVVPSIEWENETADRDETVLSDLPYITNELESPWDENDFDFEDITAVGRIPTKAETGFAEAIKYFSNTMKYKPYDSVKSFVYTARQWVVTSKQEFAHLSPYMICSPEYISEKEQQRRQGVKFISGIGDGYNLLCFNLHGSDGTHYWYGQDGGWLPIAMDGNVLTYQRKSPFFVCTEACYGARPIVTPGKASIVVHALTNNCIAFVGSSRIAYGMPDGGMCAADVIANKYTQCLLKGYTCGEAFLNALDAVYNDGDMDEVDIKTLAEFALYGDPSARLVKGKSNKIIKNVKKKPTIRQKSAKKSFALMSCDSFGFVGRSNKSAGSGLSEMEKMQIRKMASNIKLIGKNALKSANAPISEVEPKVYKVVGSAGYRAIYTEETGNIQTVVRLHLDDDGNVEKMYTSK